MSNAATKVPPPPPNLDPEPHQFTMPVDPMWAQRYAYSCTDKNPVYFDDAAARAAGYAGKIAPVLYASSMLEYQAGPAEEDLKEDGVSKGLFPKIVKDGAILMGGGQDIEFFEPMYQGDTFTARRTVINHYKKPSKQRGELDFIVMESIITNQKGQKVMRIVDTLIAKQPD